MKNYTEEDVRFILDNYIKNQNLCVRETEHSLSSIKLMLQNISATYGFINFGKGNPMYTRVADQFREENQIFDKPMSKKSFCMRFGVIKE